MAWGRGCSFIAMVKCCVPVHTCTSSVVIHVPHESVAGLIVVHVTVFLQGWSPATFGSLFDTISYLITSECISSTEL